MTATTTKLSDMHRVLLSSASQRDDGSLMPLPKSIAAKPLPAYNAMKTLLKRQLAEERPTTLALAIWRREPDQTLGLFLTDAGRASIGLPPAHPKALDLSAQPKRRGRPKKVQIDAVPVVMPRAAEPLEEEVPAEKAGASSNPRKVNKRAEILKLMRRKRGASIEELMAVTGWLPHSTRGALSTLRANGMTIERIKRGETSYYHLVGEAK